MVEMLMDKMERPNIFKYATRELSQDAMVCWLLKCLHSTDLKYMNIGLNFIRLIFDDETIQANEIIIESDSPHKQYYHMDVYTVVCLRDKIYPIIFENKTSTYLHSNQFQAYCTKVANWMNGNKKYLSDLSKKMNNLHCEWGGIIYVFFKTGFMFGWQQKDFKQQTEDVSVSLAKSGITLLVREIYLDDMVDFLGCQKRDELLDDYYCFLNNQKTKKNFAIGQGMDSVTSCYKALDDNTGSNETECALLFQRIFGGDSKFTYNYQQWAAKDLFSTTDKNGNTTNYCLRFERCNYKSKIKAPAFQLQQHQFEKDVSEKEDALENKTNEAVKIQEVCKEIINEMNTTNVEYRFEQLKCFPCKAYNGQMIMKFFIVDKSDPETVCNFIAAFSKALCDKVNDLFDIVDIK